MQVTVGLSELLVEFLLITLAFGWTLLSKEGGATGSGHVPIMGRLGMMLSSGSALTGRLGFVSVIAVAQVCTRIDNPVDGLLYSRSSDPCSL